MFMIMEYCYLRGRDLTLFEICLLEVLMTVLFVLTNTRMCYAVTTLMLIVIALNKYFSSSSSSGLSKNHITFLSNVDNNTFMVVSKESKNNSEISVSHFDSAERNEDYLIKSIDNFTLSSSYNDNKLSINSHYENDPLNEEVKNIKSYFFHPRSASAERDH